MIGFFEHQYLKFKKSHLQNLIALAKSDDHFHEKEEALIYKIGEKYKLKERQIKKLIESKESAEIHIPETHEQKMEQLYDLVRMIYADEVVEESEVEFCQNVMTLFGYKKEIVPWMIKLFEREHRPMGKAWEAIVEEAKASFLK